MTQSCREGNKCMRSALRLIRSLERHGIPWILEHPRTVRSWWLPELRKYVDKPHIELVHLDQCQYGRPWKKATSVLCSRIDPRNLERLSRRCHGVRGSCPRKHKPHKVLRGADPKSGKNWTSRASPYPPRLAESLAFALTDNTRHSAHLFSCCFYP